MMFATHVHPSTINKQASGQVHLVPDKQCVMEEVVLSMTHQVTQLDRLGVGRHNSPAGQKGSMHPGLTFGYVMPLAALYETARHEVTIPRRGRRLDSTVDMQIGLRCDDMMPFLTLHAAARHCPKQAQPPQQTL